MQLKLPLTISIGTAAIIALVLALLSGAGSGYVGYSWADAKGQSALATYKQQVEAQAQHVQQVQVAQFLAQQQHVNDLGKKLDAANQQLAQAQQQAHRSIDHVTTVYVPAPHAAPVPLPRCVFTAGFVRAYNAAIGVPDAAEGTAASGDAAPSAATGAADTELLDSGLRESDILAHITDYGARCRAVENQLNSILDYEGAP